MAMANRTLPGQPLYPGTNARNAPNYYFESRRPDRYDRDANIGDFWLFTDPAPLSDFQELYVLVSLEGNVDSAGELSKWILIGSGSGDLQHLTSDDAVVVLPQAGNINIKGDGESIYTTSDNTDGSIIIHAIGGAILDTIVSNSGIMHPVPETIGVLGGNQMNTSISGSNIFVHWNANAVVIPGGSLTFADFGLGVVQSDATGRLFSDNGEDGQFILGGGTTGVAPKWTYLTTTTPGALDITSGVLAGDPFLNIDFVGASGIEFATDSGPGNNAVPTLGVIEILGAANQIDTASPFTGNVVAISLSDTLVVPGTVTFDDPTLAGPGFVRTDAAGVMSVLPDSASDGQLIISSASGDPIWASLTAGANIVLTPGANSISIAATGGSGNGINIIHTNAGDAIIDLGDDSVNIVGTGNMNVTGDGVHTATITISNSPTFTGTVEANNGYTSTLGDLTLDTGTVVLTALGEGVGYLDNTGHFISLGTGTDGQLLIGATGTLPAWNNITSGSITITNGPNTINIEGGGGGGSLSVLAADTGTAIPSVGVITIAGGLNINTAAVGSVLTVNLNTSVFLPYTTTGGIGVWAAGASIADTFLHNLDGVSPGGSVFLGQDAGNLTMTTATSNTAVGAGALNGVTTGGFNIAIGGGGPLSSLTTGRDNVAIGIAAGSAIVTTNSNILINNSGNILDNNAIRIGTQGSGFGQTDKTFIAGIYNTFFSTPNQVVSIDSAGKLGSSVGTDGQILISATAGSASWANITAGAGITVTNGPNSIIITNTGGGGGGGAQNFLTQGGTAVAGSIVPGRIVINGGENTNTTGATDTVVINLNRSISWPSTAINGATPGGYEGLIRLNSLLFMHGRGTRNAFLGESAGNLTLTTGSATDNTAIGANSMTSLTTGQFNSALGSSTLQALTSGSHNVAVGRNALLSVNTGTSNVAIGSGCLDSATTCTNNVAMGRLSLAAITTSSNNVALGHNAGQVATSADQMVLIGSGAGTSITTGGLNVAVGFQALNNVTTGVGNTAVGYEALNNITTGAANIAIGLQAGSSLTIGNKWNIYFGHPGVAGESGTIRLGVDDPSPAVYRQTSTFIAGTYNKSVNTTPLALFQSSDGKVGTSAPGAGNFVMLGGYGTVTSSDGSLVINNTSLNTDIIIRQVGFSARSAGSGGVAVTGGGQEWYMAATASTSFPSFNTNSCFTSGIGGIAANGAYFTAPFNGMYMIGCQFQVNKLLPPPPPPPPPVAIAPISCPIFIRVTSANPGNNQVFSLIDSTFGNSTTGAESRAYSAMIRLLAGDIVKFSISLGEAGAPPTPNPNIFIYPGSANNVGTYAWGHLIYRL
jgi:hypothetical protein